MANHRKNPGKDPDAKQGRGRAKRVRDNRELIGGRVDIRRGETSLGEGVLKLAHKLGRGLPRSKGELLKLGA